MRFEECPSEWTFPVSGDEGPDWALIWPKIVEVCLPTIRRLVSNAKTDPSATDDILQEFAIHLLENRAGRLRSFRGNTLLQFRSFLRASARHHARDYLRRRARELDRRMQADRAAAHADRAGPDESQIRRDVAEFAEQFVEADRRWILDLLDVERKPGNGVDTREVERRSLSIFRKHFRRECRE